MSVVFDWFGMAEGAVNDARGALTLVGVGQNICFAQAFPHREPRTFIVTVLDEDGGTLTRDAKVDMTFQVTTPSGRVLVATSQVFDMGRRHLSVVPPGVEATGFQLVMPLQLEFSEHGRHRCSCELSLPDGTTLERHRNIYVVPPPPATSPTD